MKGKIVMKVRPEGDGHEICTKINLKQVGVKEKIELLRAFLDHLEISASDAATYLLLIAGGAVARKTRKNGRWCDDEAVSSDGCQQDDGEIVETEDNEEVQENV